MASLSDGTADHIRADRKQMCIPAGSRVNWCKASADHDLDYNSKKAAVQALSNEGSRPEVDILKVVHENVKSDKPSKFPTWFGHHQPITAKYRILSGQKSKSVVIGTGHPSVVIPSIDQDTATHASRARASNFVRLDPNCLPYACSLTSRSLESISANYSEASSVVLALKPRDLQTPDLGFIQPSAFRRLTSEALSALLQLQLSTENARPTNKPESDIKTKCHGDLNYYPVFVPRLEPPMDVKTGMKHSLRYLSVSTTLKSRTPYGANGRIPASLSTDMVHMMKTSCSIQPKISRHFIVRHRARIRARWPTAIGKVHG